MTPDRRLLAGAAAAVLGLWALGVAAWTAQRAGARRLATGVLAASVAVLGVGLALHEPLPRTLEQVVEGGSNGPLSDAAWSWVCRMEV